MRSEIRAIFNLRQIDGSLTVLIHLTLNGSHSDDATVTYRMFFYR